MNQEFTGLSDFDVKASRLEFGENQIVSKKRNRLLEILIDLVKEPMIVLLLTAAALYFLVGAYDDGAFLLVAVFLVASISVFQENRSKKALDSLKNFSAPSTLVLRNGEWQTVKSEELVVGDVVQLEEGSNVPADAAILSANDFSLQESIMTGESIAVFKNTPGDPVFQGTTVATGLAIAKITAVGSATALGKIGESIDTIQTEKTPLERQINSFVRRMVIIGLIFFVIVWILNYMQSREIVDSLLKALTLAMSILPEEIPVAFSTFMALGAWELMQAGIIVKQMKTVETLGSATVICTDKTGTITENQMSLEQLYLFANQSTYTKDQFEQPELKELLQYAMFASEPIPFDPMEVSIHSTYAENTEVDERAVFRMAQEYPLGGKPPMMTHIFTNANDQRIIAAKGAPEAIFKVSHLTEEQELDLQNTMEVFAIQGYRVLGVAKSDFSGQNYPEKQQDLPFEFLGLLVFYDPPKAGVNKVLQQFYDAGIDVKIITGDNAATTQSIAKEIGFRHLNAAITGTELMSLDEQLLGETVEEKHIFSRMFPEAKLRIVNALKKNGEIVAMTGDGVNDGPALKAAHIGIAMGKKGTEIAKDAASLILMEDDFSKMVSAVAMGRRIYTNLKKAIQYIISIHIPIILTVSVPLIFGWIYPNIFTPVHVIFLELVMGPTCSIVYQKEPLEAGAMQEAPRPYTHSFFSFKELIQSIIQGLMISAGVLLIYWYAVENNASEDLTRTLVFITLISSNILLTLVNRSFVHSIFKTLGYKNPLMFWVITSTICITAILVLVPLFANFFGFVPPSIHQVAIALVISFISVFWFEVWKGFRSERF